MVVDVAVNVTVAVVSELVTHAASTLSDPALVPTRIPQLTIEPKLEPFTVAVYFLPTTVFIVCYS